LRNNDEDDLKEMVFLFYGRLRGLKDELNSEYRAYRIRRGWNITKRTFLE
jgi:hypothetical protein